VSCNTARVGALETYLEKVRTCAYSITDADVQAVKDAGVSEDEIFELTVAVAVEEGRRRLAAAERAIG
jgi:alkylhydroperoxidase family enzyme